MSWFLLLRHRLCPPCPGGECWPWAHTCGSPSLHWKTGLQPLQLTGRDKAQILPCILRGVFHPVPSNRLFRANLYWRPAFPGPWRSGASARVRRHRPASSPRTCTSQAGTGGDGQESGPAGVLQPRPAPRSGAGHALGHANRLSRNARRRALPAQATRPYTQEGQRRPPWEAGAAVEGGRHAQAVPQGPASRWRGPHLLVEQPQTTELKAQPKTKTETQDTI